MKRGSSGNHPIPRLHPPQEDNTDSWLMSYADMITLLLSFFIIFVSVSEPKQDKIVAITEGMAQQFGAIQISTPYLGTFRNLQGIIENNKAFRDIAVEKTERGLEIELSSGSFFQPESAEIEPMKMDMIKEVVDALKNGEFADYNLTIEGHTDDAPLKGNMYASNWELSAARATRMIRILTENGLDPKHMKAVGYADTQPKVPNTDAQGNPIIRNREQNRRVVIKLERK